MKAKSGYNGLASISLSFSTKSPDLLKLPGNNAKIGIINDLFDAGNEDEARRLLRSALADISQNLDKILDDEGKKTDMNDQWKRAGVASLKLSLER